MSDIFQEVEEDVRRERYEQLWKKYGNYAVGAAALLVLGAGAYQAWKYYDLQQREAISDRFQAASQLVAAGNAPRAEAEFAALTKEATSGYATLAKFHLAGAYLAQGKRDAAVVLLRELTAISDPVLASAARLRLAWALADASPKADIAATLQPLIAADNPWRFAAQEVLAYMDLKEGSRIQAEAEYAKLSQDQEAPQSLRQRATGIAQYLKANPPPGASPAAAPNPAPRVKQ